MPASSDPPPRQTDENHGRGRRTDGDKHMGQVGLWIGKGLGCARLRRTRDPVRVTSGFASRLNVAKADDDK